METFQDNQVFLRQASINLYGSIKIFEYHLNFMNVQFMKSLKTEIIPALKTESIKHCFFFLKRILKQIYIDRY